MKIKNLFLLAALGLMASATLTSCEDILGEWSRPTPAVVTPSAIAVTSITLDADATINVGETKTLTATVAPDNATDKTVSWSTSDDAVATVTDGVVTAVAAGTAVITATANDGSGVKAQCTVTVKIPGLLTGKFTINGDGDQVQFSQGNLQAKIASYASNAATASEWKFADSQYSYIGNAAGNNSFAVDTWVDLFSWVGNSADNDTYGLITFGSSSQANHGNVTSESLKTDWGKLAISNGGNTANSGWRTLTGGYSGEWNYLLKTRTTGGTVFGTVQARYAYATINTDVDGGVNGIILFPDGVNIASTEVATAGIVNDDTAWGTKCTSAQWTALEAKGCVFLPAAGYRYYGPTVDKVSVEGHYWSSSGSYETYASKVKFDSSFLQVKSDDRYYGSSVRLVRDVAE